MLSTNEHSNFIERLGERLLSFLPPSSTLTSRNLQELGILAIGILVTILSLFISLTIFLLSSPGNFPVGEVVRIEEGQTLKDVSYYLDERGVIESPFIFMVLVRWYYGGDSSLVAGDYFFESRNSVYSVANKITKGMYGMIPLKITVPEGATVREISELLEQELDSFDGEEFVRLAIPFEGYLFPDTYFFYPTVTPKEALETMEENFSARTEELKEEIELSGRTLEEVVIMASIVEKEGEEDFEARQKIAGVLWKRIDIGMPLQVDAVFPYIIGRNTFDLTHEDLATDSPYNTYVYKGLPPGPISNPGTSALKATLDPIDSGYLFYLADRTGRTHFAETFDKHLMNKSRYLD